MGSYQPHQSSSSPVARADRALASLGDSAQDALLIAQANGRFTYVNDAACALLGYQQGELLGEDAPAELRECHRRSRERITAGAGHVMECQLPTKQGPARSVGVSAHLQANGDWQAFLRDLSGSRADALAQNALTRELETERGLLRTLLETLPVGVLIFRPDKPLIFNQRTEDILGMTLSTGGGWVQDVDRVRALGGAPIPEERLAILRALGRGETITAEEYLVERPDGSRVPVLASAQPLRDADGRVIAAVGVFQDVSERMRMELAIRANERQLQEIINLLPVGVWVADRTGRLLRTNPAGERIWGEARYLPKEEFGQYKAWWIESGKLIAADEWGMARAVSRGETCNAELIRIQSFDGALKTIIHSAAPLRGDSGEIVGGIVVNEDVTLLHQAQEKLRDAVRDREQILSIVAHDLRNPLMALLAVAQSTDRVAARCSKCERIRASMATLTEIVGRMSGLVDDLLAVSVAQAGGPSMLQDTPVPASDLVAQALDAARLLLEKSRLELRLHVADNLPQIQADRDRVLRVFANLVDNAIKHTPVPGSVTMSAELSSGGVLFGISNSGPALAHEDLNAMFRPFWQAGADRRGAGLGLAICRSIVEAHGGTIWAEPAENQRVRICFVLPQVRTAAYGS